MLLPSNFGALSTVPISDKVSANLLSTLNPKEVLFIGDTLHDNEVAQAIDVDCALVSCGHQSKNILSKANRPIIGSVKDIFSLL